MNTMTMTNTLKYSPSISGRLLTWGIFALILIVAPMIFNKGASLSILSQIGAAMIFGLSYNMLLGQGGMLSFGHAVYSGLGAFFAIHAMNLAGNGAIWLPVTLVPLLGGLAGMFFGVLFGYVTTKKSGTTFAMITLGIVELVFACSLMFPEFFGGEGGIATNRVIGEPFLGISYGPQIQVYYLIAFWLFISTIGMYAFTQTPLGRVINAVRDNPERVAFIGYDPQRVRYLTLILSAFFAGIAGGLAAINFEIVTAENVSVLRSGAVLLFTYIGGAGFFFGPLIGAVIGIFLTVVLAGFTKAWQLYLGMVFILVVMYAPGGVAGIIALNMRLLRHGKFAGIRSPLCMVSAAAAVALASMITAIEMLYHLTLESDHGTTMTLFGIAIDAAASTPWLVALALTTCGSMAFLHAGSRFRKAWGEANAEIESMSRGAQA